MRCTNCTAVHALGGRDHAFSTTALERSTDRCRTHETRIALRAGRPGLRVNAKVHQLYGDGGCRVLRWRMPGHDAGGAATCVLRWRCPIANGNACMDVPVDVPFPLGASRRANPHPAVGVAACNKNTVTFHNRVGTGYTLPLVIERSGWYMGENESRARDGCQVQLRSLLTHHEHRDRSWFMRWTPGLVV